MRYFLQDQGMRKKLIEGMYLIFQRLIFEHNPREISSAFHKAGAAIGQNNHLPTDIN